jgi:hypothetical protein
VAAKDHHTALRNEVLARINAGYNVGYVGISLGIEKIAELLIKKLQG